MHPNTYFRQAALLGHGFSEQGKCFILKRNPLQVWEGHYVVLRKVSLQGTWLKYLCLPTKPGVEDSLGWRMGIRRINKRRMILAQPVLLPWGGLLEELPYFNCFLGLILALSIFWCVLSKSHACLSTASWVKWALLVGTGFWWWMGGLGRKGRSHHWRNVLSVLVGDVSSGKESSAHTLVSP